jgi:drug efflux transport system permease protein
MFGRIKALIIKEILTVWRDRKSRFFLLFPPIFQLFVFAFAATLDVKNVPIAFLNRDNGKASFELIQRFRGSPTFRKNFHIETFEQMANVIDTQKAVMVIQFDEQFSRNLYANQPAQLQLILDGRKSNTAQVVLGYAQQIIQRFNQDFAALQGLPHSSSRLVPRYWFNPNLLYSWFNVPNLCGVLTMIVCIIITSLSVARERELGTFDQMLVSPLRPLEILLGKTLPALIISLAEASVILWIAIFFFRIPFTGSFFLLYFSLIVFIFSIVGVGLFLSSISMTQQQAVLGSFIFLSPALLLSGYATPIENMPQWLQYIDIANPLRYFLVIVKGLFLKEMPADLVLANTWPMFLIGLFTYCGAGWFFSRRLE